MKKSNDSDLERRISETSNSAKFLNSINVFEQESDFNHCFLLALKLEQNEILKELVNEVKKLNNKPA